MTEGPKNTGENGAAGSAAEPNEWEMMAQEAAQEAAARRGAKKPNEGELDYQRKLLEMSQRDENFDPLANDVISQNETNTGINAKGQEYQRMAGNAWDMYARRGKSRDREYFDDQNAWHKTVEKTMSLMPQEENESPKEYQERVLSVAYREISLEQNMLPGRSLTSAELDSLVKSYPRQDGENTAAWAKRISEETGIRFGAAKAEAATVESGAAAENGAAADEEGLGEVEKVLSDREKFDARFADARDRLDKNADESDEDYEKRVKTLVFSEIMTEQASNADRKLDEVEAAELAGMYPRSEGESDEDWAKRIKSETDITVDLGGVTRADMGVDSGSTEAVTGAVVEGEDTGAENSAEDAEKHERAERARAALKTDLFANMCKKYDLKKDDIDGLSDDDVLLALEAYKQQLVDWARKPVSEGGAGYSDEQLKQISEAGSVYLEDLMKRFNDYIGSELGADGEKGDKGAEGGENAEAAEAERKRMMEAMDIADLRDLLKAEGMNNDEIEKLSPEQMKDLQERLRKRMVESLDIEDLKEIMKSDDIKIEKLQDMSFEELRDLREKYRQKFMGDIDVKEHADKLKEWGIKDVGLENMTLEQLIALKKRLEAEGKDKVEKKPEDEKKPEALISMMVDTTDDARAVAGRLAEDLLKKRIEGKGKSKIGKAIRNWFFGTMLKDYEERRYQRLALDAIKDKKDKFESDGYSVNVGDYMSLKGDGAGGKLVERMTLAYTEGMEDSLIHTANGDEMATYGVEVDENGNQKVFKYSERGNKKEAIDANSVEAKSTIAVREAIASYATGKMTERDFREAVNRVKYDMSKEGRDAAMFDTLFETARAAKERVEHQVSIDDVMDGWRLINAEYHARERTEAHRSKIDQLVNKYESSKLGAIVKPEIVAAAAGIFMTLGQSGARTIGNAIAPMVGGAAVGGFFAGLREHEHVAMDRAEQARRVARGEQIGDTKYDRQMRETLYDTYSANDLADGLKKAIENGNTAEMQKALTMIEALDQISGAKKIDLIRFTAGDTASMEDERLALDVQVARAKVELRNKGIDNKSKEYVEATRRAYEVINDDIDAKDAAFRKLQAKRVAAQAAKTAGMGIAIGLGVQEVTAAFDPSSYGLFDKLNDNLNIRVENLGLGVNNVDAHKTILAGFLGINNDQVITVAEQVRAAEATGAKLTDEEVEQLRKEGYTVNERDVVSTQEVSRTETVNASEYARENGVSVKRSWGNNGTEGIYEGNELGIHQASDGHLYTRMSGDSWNGTQTVNFEQAAQDGKIDLFVSMSRDSQATPIRIPGVMKDGQIHFFTEDPELTRIIANQDYAFAEVAYVSGEKAANGATKIFNFATDVGHNSVSESFTRTITDTVVNHETVFDVIGFERQAEKIIAGSSLIDGAPAFPFAGRKNLTLGKKGKAHTPRGPENPGRPVPPTPDNPGGGGESVKQVDPNPPSAQQGGGNPPFPPAGGSTSNKPPINPPNGPKQVAEKPIQATQIEQQPDSGTPQIEQKPESNTFESSVDLGEPWGNMVTRVEFTDEEIDALETDEAFKARLKQAIALWNSASEEERKKYMTGDGIIGTPLNDANQMLMHLGKDYIGNIDAVAKTRERARAAVAAKREAEAKEAAKEAAESAELMRQADAYVPINDASDTRNIMVSDKRIAELNPSQKPTADDLRVIRAVLTGWNRMDPDQRKMMLEGKFDGATNNVRANEYMKTHFDILRKFNIIALPEAGVSDEGEALAA